jgi:hypothetical protein
LLEDLTKDNFFESAIFMDNQEVKLKIWEQREKLVPVRVLGIVEPEQEPHYIIADIDAHCYGQKCSPISDRGTIPLDTSNENDRRKLQAWVDGIIEFRKENGKYVSRNCNYEVHAYMGTISAYEIILYYDINFACERDTALLALLQHGATSNMPYNKAKVEEADLKAFPAILDQTTIAAIFPETEDKVIRLKGRTILAFYKYMNEEQNYNFRMHEIWKKQLEKVRQQDIQYICNQLGYEMPVEKKRKGEELNQETELAKRQRTSHVVSATIQRSAPNAEAASTPALNDNANSPGWRMCNII